MGSTTEGVHISPAILPLPPQQDSHFYLLPDEVIQKIFYLAGMKTLLKLSEVSRRFSRNATDSSLWKTFCRSLPHFRPDHEKEGRDYRRLAFQLSYLSSNFAHNQYALEAHQYPADACRITHTQKELIIVRPDFIIEIYDPETQGLKKAISLSPCSEQILEIEKLKEKAITRSVHSMYEPEEIQRQRLTALLEDIQECAAEPEVSHFFQDYKKLLQEAAEQLDDEECQTAAIGFQIVGILQRVWDETSKSIASTQTVLAKDTFQIRSLSTCQNYLVITYATSSIDIVDLQTGQKDSFIWNGVSTIHFVSNTLFWIMNNALFAYNFEKKELKQSSNVMYAKKLDESRLLFIDTTHSVYLLKVETNERELQFTSDRLIIDICYAFESRIFFYIVEVDERLVICNSKDRAMIPLSITGTLSFNHGFLWLFGEDASVTKINPLSGEKSTVIPPATKRGEWRQTGWLNEKFCVLTFGKGMEIFNYLATPKEIAISRQQLKA